ncbi:MAG: hypothetical protein ACE5K7_05295, partial [Phycisphaerae bacterium]
WMLAWAIGCCLVGCQRPAVPGQPAAVELQGVQFEGLWQTALEVLRRYDFRPDRQDRRAGIITTHPTTSQQWFEFWRRDAIGPYQFAEASLHTIRRQVTVRIQRGGEPTACRLGVQVDTYRYSAPERQVTTASGALQIFGEKLPTAQGQLQPRAVGQHWVPLGRDPLLEAELVKRIVWLYRPAASPTATEAPPATDQPGS